MKEQSNTSLLAEWCDILAAVGWGAARWRFRVFQNSAELPVIALNCGSICLELDVSKTLQQQLTFEAALKLSLTSSHSSHCQSLWFLGCLENIQLCATLFYNFQLEMMLPFRGFCKKSGYSHLEESCWCDKGSQDWNLILGHLQV